MINFIHHKTQTFSRSIIYVLNKSFLIYFFRIVIPNFNKTLSRECTNQKVLPTFMQVIYDSSFINNNNKKSMNSRMALNMPKEKNLEVNNYSDSRFQTMTTCFSPKKSQPLLPKKSLRNIANMKSSSSKFI